MRVPSSVHQSALATAPALPKPMSISVASPRGDVTGILARSPGARSAVILLGGAGGGMKGPSGIYAGLARRLQGHGVSALRLSYRKPNDLAESTYDVLAAIDAFKRQGITKVALIGWSFGGAVAINAAARSDAVTGVATVASQSLGTEAAAALDKKSLLLMHGTQDAVLPQANSRDIFERDGGPNKELVLYAGDDHALSRSSRSALKKLFSWSSQLLSAGK